MRKSRKLASSHLLFLLVAVSPQASMPVAAQENQQRGEGDKQPVVVSGSVQSDFLFPTGSQADGSHEDVRNNTYVEVQAMSKYIDAGVRMEYLEHPLPGFEKDFKGWGVPFFYVKGKLKNAELTLGTFYEQFGSGFVLRTYEERSLGVDNSLLGGRLVLTPLHGMRIKALAGKQRRYWNLNHAWISGADMELDLDEYIKPLAAADYHLTLGGSWVNKHEKASDDEIFVDATHRLNLPAYVNAWDVRANLQKGAFCLLAEYAQKTQDPSFDNGYSYRPGHVGMLSTSYSQKGFSLLLQVKRSDNFSFRSRRSMSGTSSFINHLPAFTEDQTYALAALYPYATHPAGEMAYQGQLGYKFKRHSLLGGRYGTNLKVNFSHVNSIRQETTQTYYQDMDVQLEHRFNRDFKLNLLYMNQFYNKTVVEGEGGMIHSDIFVADALFRLSPHTNLRTELQYLATRDDQKDWLFGLAELSMAPHWMLTASDEYNVGDTKNHYWQTYVTYSTGAHRLQLGWGRTRAGYNCSGGVCRYVPESKGFTLSYNYNF